jgi:hypothetical protein
MRLGWRWGLFIFGSFRAKMIAVSYPRLWQELLNDCASYFEEMVKIFCSCEYLVPYS